MGRARSLADLGQRARRATRRVLMLERLKRHPLAVEAHFRHSLVLTYAWPRQVLEPLLPPGLVLDRHHEFGFTAIALVQTERLRPAFLPASLGLDFFLIGYRIFVRVVDAPSLRGLYILRSDTDRRTMVALEVREASFLESPVFSGRRPVLANAFHVEAVDYRWERGEVLTR